MPPKKNLHRQIVALQNKPSTQRFGSSETYIEFGIRELPDGTRIPMFVPHGSYPDGEKISGTEGVFAIITEGEDSEGDSLLSPAIAFINIDELEKIGFLVYAQSIGSFIFNRGLIIFDSENLPNLSLGDSVTGNLYSLTYDGANNKLTMGKEGVETHFPGTLTARKACETLTTSTTLTEEMSGKFFMLNNSAALTITIPDLDFPLGTHFSFSCMSSDYDISFVPASTSVTLHSLENKNKISQGYGVVHLLCIGEKTWLLSGDLKS